MKYFILGGDGFIARNIYSLLKSKDLNVMLLTKKDFDLTDEKTYSKFDFSNATIIDCVAKIDENEDLIFYTNVTSLQKFINYLNSYCRNFKYIYFSTASTQLTQDLKLNPYIHSKILAEKFIEKNLKDYKIIRLIFPFGKGENKNRLLSKLIYKIKNGEDIIINNVHLNLTPIELLKENFLNLLENEMKAINFSDGKVYSLKEIIDALFELLKKEKRYTYKKEVIVNLYIEKKSEKRLPIYLLKELINE